MAFHVPEKFRIKDGEYGSDSSYGNYGAFHINMPPRIMGRVIRVIASEGMGWEHVSVSLENQTPSWEIMCYIKDMFWDDTDCVIQFHPPASEYVNHHKYCLHLWRKIGYEFPLPDSILVGPKKK